MSSSHSVLERELRQQAEIVRLRGLLRELEWCKWWLRDDGEMLQACPKCLMTPTDGHTDNCPLRMELEGKATTTMVEAKFKRLHENAIAPAYAHNPAEDVGMDLFAVQHQMIQPQEVALVPLGFAMEIPPGVEAEIRARSSVAKKGVIIPNAPATIDPGYRGPVMVMMMNLGQQPFVIDVHDRIAQMVIDRYEGAWWTDEKELAASARSEGGFGSTGR